MSESLSLVDGKLSTDHDKLLKQSKEGDANFYIHFNHEQLKLSDFMNPLIGLYQMPTIAVYGPNFPQATLKCVLGMSADVLLPSVPRSICIAVYESLLSEGLVQPCTDLSLLAASSTYKQNNDTDVHNQLSALTLTEHTDSTTIAAAASCSSPCLSPSFCSLMTYIPSFHPGNISFYFIINDVTDLLNFGLGHDFNIVHHAWTFPTLAMGIRQQEQVKMGIFMSDGITIPNRGGICINGLNDMSVHLHPAKKDAYQLCCSPNNCKIRLAQLGQQYIHEHIETKHDSEDDPTDDEQHEQKQSGKTGARGNHTNEQKPLTDKQRKIQERRAREKIERQCNMDTCIHPPICSFWSVSHTHSIPYKQKQQEQRNAKQQQQQQQKQSQHQNSQKSQKPPQQQPKQQKQQRGNQAISAFLPNVSSQIAPSPPRILLSYQWLITQHNEQTTQLFKLLDKCKNMQQLLHELLALFGPDSAIMQQLLQAFKSFM